MHVQFQHFDNAGMHLEKGQRRCCTSRGWHIYLILVRACVYVRGEAGKADVLACVKLAACLTLTHADHRSLMHKSSSSLFINVST